MLGLDVRVELVPAIAGTDLPERGASYPQYRPATTSPLSTIIVCKTTLLLYLHVRTLMKLLGSKYDGMIPNSRTPGLGSKVCNRIMKYDAYGYRPYEPDDRGSRMNWYRP